MLHLRKHLSCCYSKKLSLNVGHQISLRYGLLTKKIKTAEKGRDKGLFP